MPVVFLCHGCRSRLSVSRRKIGTQVDCPRCRLSLTVPVAEAAAATVAMANVGEGSRSGDAFPEFAVFDDPTPSPPPLPPGQSARDKAATKTAPPSTGPTKQAPQAPSPNGQGQTKTEKPPAPKPRRGKTPAADAAPATARDSSEQPAAPASSTAKSFTATSPAKSSSSKSTSKSDSSASGESATPGSDAASPPAEPVAAKGSSRHALGVVKDEDQPSSFSDVLLIRRRTLYLQAALICLMAAVGLMGGYFFGRAMGPIERKPPPVDSTVQIAGTLTVRDTRGAEAPDSGAVVIVLPADVSQDRIGNVQVAGLAPGAARELGRAAEMAIEELGGKYERTDGKGNFSLRLPKAGRYQLLFISSSPRPQGQNVSAAHLKDLQRFFVTPQNLIGGQRYAWVTRDVHGPQVAIWHTF